jgi:Papain family cysteine protease
MAIIESCYKKLTGQTVDLSEQQFVDCARGYQQANGCKGAEFHTYLKWAEEKKTLATSNIFPYQ